MSFISFAIVGAVALTPLIVQADETVPGVAAGSTMTISGFGTLGAVITDTDESQYRANLRQSHGATTSASLSPDSRFGLQLNAQLTDMFSIGAQVLTLHRDGSDRPNLEWLYAQARLAPGVDASVGRLVLPAFFVSDSRAVGFSQVWIRPPREVYDGYPATWFDGAQMSYRFGAAGANVRLQASLGSAEATLYSGARQGDLSFKKLSSLGATVEYGNWTAKLGRTVARNLTTTIPGRAAPLSANVHDAFTDVALQYDDGKLVALGEFVARRQDHGGMGDQDSFYTMGGYHFGAFTPFVIYSHFTGIGGNFAAHPKGKSWAGGVRWDYSDKVSLKAQLDRTLGPNRGIGEAASFIAHPVPVKVLGLAAEFVF